LPITQDQANWFKDTFSLLVGNVEKAVIGKESVIRLALTCLLSEGHLLLEDYPGTGKTSLAKSIAHTVQGSSSRIQFTPDLLPSDVTGVTIFDQAKGGFEFHPGPIFANIVLADEINRASPKTQSALLEVMEEGVVTIDGRAHRVGSPFMVIATQNPIEQAGTYRLPEAQLDRFLMKTSLGYPDVASTTSILLDAANRDRSQLVTPIIAAEIVSQMAKAADEVTVERSILEYVANIAQGTRNSRDLRMGVSTRGCLALIRAAKTFALSKGRQYVIPDDIKDLMHPVFDHRVILASEAEFQGVEAGAVISEIINSIPVPMLKAS
jgi:MoxR-like ATPase